MTGLSRCVSRIVKAKSSRSFCERPLGEHYGGGYLNDSSRPPALISTVAQSGKWSEATHESTERCTRTSRIRVGGRAQTRSRGRQGNLAVLRARLLRRLCDADDHDLLVVRCSDRMVIATSFRKLDQHRDLVGVSVLPCVAAFLQSRCRRRVSCYQCAPSVEVQVLTQPAIRGIEAHGATSKGRDRRRDEHVVSSLTLAYSWP